MSRRFGFETCRRIDPVREPSIRPDRAVDSLGRAAEILDAAGLSEALRGDGPFTVFAPTDEAFAKLPAGTIEGLLQDKSTLKSILTYHVVPGKVLAGDVAKLHEAETLQGSRIKIDTSHGVMVDGAKVIMTDIMTSNGVIHVIDSVVTPS